MLTRLAEGADTAASVTIRGLQGLFYTIAAWYGWFYPRWYLLHRYLPLVRQGHEHYLKARMRTK